MSGTLFDDQGQTPERNSANVPIAGTPLAERMRPRSLDEIVGQEAVLGPGAPLRVALEHDRVQSLILWGPPGKIGRAHV